MSNKSSTSSQIISLPKGGGAFQGIGEKFSPDLFTGTGNFTVPIALPPGRNGFQPQLNLVYSTGKGNGPLGNLATAAKKAKSAEEGGKDGRSNGLRASPAMRTAKLPTAYRKISTIHWWLRKSPVRLCIRLCSKMA